MNPLHEQFLAESRELILEATEDLIEMEREGRSTTRTDRLFRAFHTLKGSAGVVELPAMTLAMHAAEDLLAAVHAGRVDLTSAIVSKILSCLDQVSRWLNDFETRKVLPPHAGEDARDLAEGLRGFLLGGATAKVSGDQARTSAATGGLLPDWILRLVKAQGSNWSATEGSANLVGVAYEPRTTCFFDGDDPLDVMRQVPGLLAFQIEPRDPWPSLGELDTYACNLRLHAISAGDRDAVANVFRLVPDQVLIIDIPRDALTERGVTVDAGGLSELVRAVIAEQRAVLLTTQRSNDFAARVGSAGRVAGNALSHARKAEFIRDVQLAAEEAIAQGEVGPLVSAIDAVLAARPPSAPLTDAVDVKAGATADPIEDETRQSTAHSLRVDEAKLDVLVTLAGELLVLKNSFAHLVKRLEDEVGEHDLARAFEREAEAVGRLTAEMHAAILQLRMVPVAQVFRQFPRLIRDISRRLGKTVSLVTRGETTGIDKAIVDRLFEPLLHLVRNALDHGVETPEQRRKAGKPEQASITLQASRSGDRVVVEIIDDGRGIDPVAVRRKAQERELLTGDELAALSDEQAVDLIFTAGFSTAVEISDVSGRGVGMDIVRSAVERAGGRVSIASRVGFGTTVRLDLPTTIAMSHIMVVEAGGQIFGVLMDAVTETVRLTPDRLTRIKSNLGFVLRDRVVPICSLAELMNLADEQEAAPDSRLVIVTESGGRIAALQVDAIHDRIEVVLKPMQGLLAGTRGYAGTTLLGDGRVLLVLDLKEIVP